MPRGEDRPEDADSAQPEDDEPGTWTTASRDDLENMLHLYTAARSRRDRAEGDMAAMAKLLKPWLEINVGEELLDAERGLHAYLQPRRGPKPYDLVAIRRQDLQLFERLLDTGCLFVNAKAVKAQGAQVAGINKYAGLEPISYALMVEKVDKS